MGTTLSRQQKLEMAEKFKRLSDDDLNRTLRAASALVQAADHARSRGEVVLDLNGCSVPVDDPIVGIAAYQSFLVNEIGVLRRQEKAGGGGSPTIEEMEPLFR